MEELKMKLAIFVFVILYHVNLVKSGRTLLKDFTANGQITALEISEGDEVYLSCEAEGEPHLPIVDLTRHKTDEILQVVRTNWVEGSTQQTMVTTNLTMKCEDSGLYTCLYEDVGRVTIEKFVSVFVKCAPALISSKEITKQFDVTTGANLEFDIKIFGYPVPRQYTLYHTHDRTGVFVNKLVIASMKYTVSYTQQDGADGLVVLNMIGMMDDDSGKYKLNIDNGIGQALAYTFDVMVNSAFKSLVECNSIQAMNKGTTAHPSMDLVWSCSISGVDRPPACHFTYKMEGQTGTDDDVPTAYVDNEPATTTGSPPRYEKTCTMTVPMWSLQPGVYTFKSIMYPSGLTHTQGNTLTTSLGIALNRPTCDKPVISDDQQSVKVTCQSTGLYTNVVCDFVYSKDKKAYKGSEGIVSSSHKYCSVKGALCFYHCTLKSTIGDLGEGSYTFKVKMTPVLNSAVNNSDIGIESKATPSIHLVVVPSNNNANESRFEQVKKESGDSGLSDTTFIGITVACAVIMLILGLVVGILVGKWRRRRNKAPAMTAVLHTSQDYCELASPSRPPRSGQDNTGFDPENKYATYEKPKDERDQEGFENEYNSYIDLDSGACAFPQ